MATRRDYQSPQKARPTFPSRPTPSVSPISSSSHDQPLVYREPVAHPALARLGVSAQPTAPLTSPAEVEKLKRAWLRNPTWDIEWAVGFEAYRTELANWHEDQIVARAAALGCSKLMAAIVEELVHCWIDGTRPVSPLATRILLSFG